MSRGLRAIQRAVLDARLACEAAAPPVVLPVRSAPTKLFSGSRETLRKQNRV
jgi:hypothetical protein